jgi:hypothetical protein
VDTPPASRFVRAFGPGLADALALALIAALVLHAVTHRWRGRNPEDLADHPPAIGLRFVQEHHIDGQTIFVSDYPGYLAFQTHNAIIAADMLTGNLDLYRRMRAAPDAIAFLRQEAARAGKSIRYIFYQGNSWLVPSPDLESLTYHDPHTPDSSVGRLDVGHSLVCVRGSQGQVLFAAWRFPDSPSAPPFSARGSTTPPMGHPVGGRSLRPGCRAFNRSVLEGRL